MRGIGADNRVLGVPDSGVAACGRVTDAEMLHKLTEMVASQLCEV